MSWLIDVSFITNLEIEQQDSLLPELPDPPLGDEPEPFDVEPPEPLPFPVAVALAPVRVVVPVTLVVVLPPVVSVVLKRVAIP